MCDFIQVVAPSLCHVLLHSINHIVSWITNFISFHIIQSCIILLKQSHLFHILLHSIKHIITCIIAFHSTDCIVTWIINFVCFYPTLFYAFLSFNQQHCQLPINFASLCVILSCLASFNYFRITLSLGLLILWLFIQFYSLLFHLLKLFNYKLYLLVFYSMFLFSINQ